MAVFMVLGGIGQFFEGISVYAHCNLRNAQAQHTLTPGNQTTHYRRHLRDRLRPVYVHNVQYHNPHNTTANRWPATALLEFQIPPQVARYASFMFSFLGRGVFYLFIGGIVMGSSWWKIAAGAVVVICGGVYIALEFVPSIEPPANMR